MEKEREGGQEEGVLDDLMKSRSNGLHVDIE